MPLNLDAEKIETPCPNCGHKISKEIGWLKRNKTIDCPNCKKGFGIDTRKMVEGIDSASRSLVFLSGIKKLGK